MRWWVWYVLCQASPTPQSSGAGFPSHCPTCHGLPQAPSLGRDCRHVLRDFGSFPSAWVSPSAPLTFTRIHSVLFLTAFYSDNLKGSESHPVSRHWCTSQRKTEEKECCKILACDKPGRCGCWRRTLTRWGNWGYHSWAKVQLWEESTCDTNTTNTVYINSSDQSNLSRH